ncbi:MAG: iron/manganese transporter [Chitinophagia bacterium]|nr:iron/manganese transporter [Chitinophagia bacterium]
MLNTTFDKSLQEIHGSVDPAVKSSKWRKIFAFFGPAYLVSVGYMDPGNWATDIAGGSNFGYSLIWVLLMSNVMALLLQSLSARLGIVYGRDLAQCSRDTYPPLINFILYILAELAIAACDLAEVLGMAIGLQLLFGIPLLTGVLITLADTFLLLFLQRLGVRSMEAFIIALIIVIGGCFLVEIFLAKPNLSEMATGFIPTLPGDRALYLAIGIIGATVMPHNLYLHSALVQTRKIKRTEAAIKKAILWNTVDSAIALNIAFFVNAAILVLAGTAFYHSGNRQVESIHDAYKLLSPLMGNKWASVLFAVALVASGQSSTVTGTLAGQIIMEGYLHLRLNPLARRLITRLLAIVPAALVILIAGESKIDELLVFSQVLLSIQLAYAVIPLIHAVSNTAVMGKFAINMPTKIAAWVIASILLFLNIKLFVETTFEWFTHAPNIALQILIVGIDITLGWVLLYTIFYPIVLKHKMANKNIHPKQAIGNILDMKDNTFNKVALALDFSDKDKKVIQYAIRLAKPETTFVLIHVVESASAQVMGSQTDDYETQTDRQVLDEYVALFQEQGLQAEGILGFNNRVAEIAHIVNTSKADLLVVGSHGHRTLKDWLLGETINTVRHRVSVPVFIAV